MTHSIYESVFTHSGPEAGNELSMECHQPSSGYTSTVWVHRHQINHRRKSSFCSCPRGEVQAVTTVDRRDCSQASLATWRAKSTAGFRHYIVRTLDDWCISIVNLKP